MFRFFFQAAISIVLNEVSEDELKFFLSLWGNTENTKPLALLENASKHFKGQYITLLQRAKDNIDQIEKWIAVKGINSIEPPSQIIEGINAFAKLILVSIYKPNLLYWAVNMFGSTCNYKENTKEETDSLLLANLKQADCKSPIIFICGKGMDPSNQFNAAYVLRDAKEKENAPFFKSAETIGAKDFLEKFEELRVNNQALVIQSIQLNPFSESILADLYSEVAEKKNDKVAANENFKMVLATELNGNIPRNMVIQSKKYAYEIKKPLKDKIKECFTYVNEDTLNSKQKKLAFALAIMHGMLINRVKYSFVTWSAGYRYSKTMFECAYAFLIEAYNTDTLNFEQILKFFCDASYGGVIKDQSDLSALYSICKNYLNEKIFGNKYAFSTSELYTIPENTSIDSMSQHISQMPGLEYGDLNNEGEFESAHFQQLHSNKIKSLFSLTFKSSAPIQSGVKDTITLIRNNLPLIITEADYCEQIKNEAIKSDIPPITLHFLIEARRANKILECISNDLQILNERTESGDSTSQSEIARLIVPKKWRDISFPSSEDLIKWVQSFKEKVEYIRKYLKDGVPKSYWLGGMINPFSFISAIRLFYASKKINAPYLEVQLTTFNSIDDLVEPIENAFYLSGLIMIRGRMSEGFLEDPLPGKEEAMLPLIMIQPRVDEPSSIEGTYECPIFISQHREGTSDPLNYLMNVKCLAFAFADYWAIKGVAILCTNN